MYFCSSHLMVAQCPRWCTERSSGASSVGRGGDAVAEASSWSTAGDRPESSDHARSSPKYSTSSPVRSSRLSAAFAPWASGASSSTQSRQPVGGGGHAGSGDQPGGGTQPSGGLGQFGGGL